LLHPYGEFEAKISLARYPDDQYWIRVTDNTSGLPATPTYGPFNRDEVFNQLKRLDVPDDFRDRLTERADAENKADIDVILRPAAPESSS